MNDPKALKMRVPKTWVEKVADVIGIAAIIFMFVYMIWRYSALPETIPVHFGANGVVDRYGSKSELIPFPIIGLFIFGLLTALERYPQAYNYPSRLNETNAAAFYKNARQLLNYIKNLVALLFAYCTYVIMNLTGELSFVFWLILASIFVIVIIGIIKQAKIR